MQGAQREMTLEGVAQALYERGEVKRVVTRERIRQVESRALRLIAAYAQQRLGRPPEDVWEAIELFDRPDPEGINRLRNLI